MITEGWTWRFTDTILFCSPPARWGSLDFNKGATPSPSNLHLHLLPATSPLRLVWSSCSCCEAYREPRMHCSANSVSRALEAAAHAWARTLYRALRMQLHTPAPKLFIASSGGSCARLGPNFIVRSGCSWARLGPNTYQRERQTKGQNMSMSDRTERMPDRAPDRMSDRMPGRIIYVR